MKGTFMNATSNRSNSSGTALVEIAVTVLVLAVVIAGGVYVMNHRSVTPSSTNTSTTTPAAQTGTTASIDQITQNDANTEQQADGSADAQTQQDALGANTAASNVGGAYNESTL
jgi:flagellar basal body-associated protein FliL